MKLKAGFSIIELMATVTIVAILAAVAIPSYKKYMTSANFEVLVPIMDDLLHSAVSYANLNGRFPNPGNIMTAANNSVSNTHASALNPAIQFVYAGDLSAFYGGSAPCGKAGHVSIVGTSNKVGLAGSGNFTVNCLLATKGGVVETKCFYSYSTSFGGFTLINQIPFIGQSVGTHNFIPDMTNVGAGMAAAATAFFTGSSCINS